MLGREALDHFELSGLIYFPRKSFPLAPVAHVFPQTWALSSVSSRCTDQTCHICTLHLSIYSVDSDPRSIGTDAGIGRCLGSQEIRHIRIMQEYIQVLIYVHAGPRDLFSNTESLPTHPSAIHCQNLTRDITTSPTGKIHHRTLEIFR